MVHRQDLHGAVAWVTEEQGQLGSLLDCLEGGVVDLGLAFLELVAGAEQSESFALIAAVELSEFLECLLVAHVVQELVVKVKCTHCLRDIAQRVLVAHQIQILKQLATHLKAVQSHHKSHHQLRDIIGNCRNGQLRVLIRPEQPKHHLLTHIHQIPQIVGLPQVLLGLALLPQLVLVDEPANQINVALVGVANVGGLGDLLVAVVEPYLQQGRLIQQQYRLKYLLALEHLVLGDELLQ